MIVLAGILRIHQCMVTEVNAFDPSGWLQAAADIEAELTLLVTPLSEAQFHAPPRAGGWSVGYCIEHLVLTGQAFLPKWDMALKEAGKESHGKETFRYGWCQRAILRYAADPSKWKHKTAPAFVPCSRHSIEETVDRFLGTHKEFVRRVVSSRGLDVMRTRVQSPFVSWIRYALGFSFDLVLAHERRHLRQAFRIRRQLINGM
jgi:hypothetical protein